MAMVNDRIIEDLGETVVTATGYNPAKRHFLLGFQDGSVTAWDVEENKLIKLPVKHAGWITAFLYLQQSKIYLISSNDGYLTIMQATQRLETVHIESPIYAIAFNSERSHLILGLNGGIKLYEVDELRRSGSLLRKKALQFARDHSDIVRCIVAHDGKVYTGGYDRKMIIYETSYASQEVIRPLVINGHSHTAAITSLQVVNDSDSRLWILTGCFDKSLRVWSLEGHLAHRVDFPEMVTSFCYVEKLDTVWVAARCNRALVVDLKTADNISVHVKAEQTVKKSDDEMLEITMLRYVPEYCMIVAATNRKHLIVWRYYYSACTLTLNHGTPISGIGYSRKTPNIFFTADSKGDIFRWERSTTNAYVYSKDLLQFSEMTYRRIRLQWKSNDVDLSQLSVKAALNQRRNGLNRVNSNEDTQNDFLDTEVQRKPVEQVLVDKVMRMGSLTRLEYVEDMEMIIVASEDSNIYVWLTDEKALLALETLSKYHQSKASTKEDPLLQQLDSARSERMSERVKLYSMLVSSEFCNTQVDLNNATWHSRPQIVTQMNNRRSRRQSASSDTDETEERAVTRKLAGFQCKHVLASHSNVVTCFTVVPPRLHADERDRAVDQLPLRPYLLSSGWDSRICIWDLENFRLHDIFRNCTECFDGERERAELACDGVVLDLCYCATKNLFAYACSDKMAYIRRFSPDGGAMTLVGLLQGHSDDVTSIRWNPVTDQFATASEDCTVRVWNGSGMNECLLCISTDGLAQALAVDRCNGMLIVGDRDGLTVYDCRTFSKVQHNRNSDKSADDDEADERPAVNAILHVPEHNAYFAGCSDGNIQIFNAPIRVKTPVQAAHNAERETVLPLDDDNNDV